MWGEPGIHNSSASSVGSFTEGWQRCDVSRRAEGLEECMRPIKFNLQSGATGIKFAG